MKDDVNATTGRSRSANSALIAGAGAAVAMVFAHYHRTRGVAREFLTPASLVPLPTRTMLLPMIRSVMAKAPVPEQPDDVEIDEQLIAGGPGGPEQRLLIVRRRKRASTTPAVLWLHGGGYLMGRPEMDLSLFYRILEALDVTIVTNDYRLAPEHPFPAPLDDCHAAFEWLTDNARTVGIDPGKIAIGGTSAGGGLAAALVQRVVDAGRHPLCQILLYPMLDDRTASRRNHAGRGRLVWSSGDNRRGWKAYLGHEPGEAEDRAYAVPARRDDLSGLPPAWIGVGSLDLFQPEDEAYATALTASGVVCELDVVAGGYHAFDLMCLDALGSRAFHERMIKFIGNQMLLDIALS